MSEWRVICAVGLLPIPSPSVSHNELPRMISLTRAMEIVETQTEVEALLLETNLIKRLEPRYNVLLRDDKSFPYILITQNHEFPRLMRHRGAQTQAGNYFGPFAGVGSAAPYLRCVRAGFSVAHLFGFSLCQSFASVSVISYASLCGSLCGQDWQRRL